MTQTEFGLIVNYHIERIVSSLQVKGKEYANDDVLYNFKEASEEFDGTPAQNCWGYLKKHLISIKHIANGKEVSQELIDEKIGDAINYLILMKAILVEGK